MELEEMKILLRSKLEEQSSILHEQELEAMIRRKTGSLTARIKKNIWLEWAACVCCIAVSVWAWLVYPFVYVQVLCIAAWIFSILLSGYLYALYRKIIFYETQAADIRANLAQIIVIVSRFTRLYYRISLGLLPVIFFVGLVTGYMDVSRNGLLNRFHWSAGLLLYTVAFAVWAIVIFFFTRWYIRKLYGDYLSQLKQQLKDVENG